MTILDKAVPKDQYSVSFDYIEDEDDGIEDYKSTVNASGSYCVKIEPTENSSYTKSYVSSPYTVFSRDSFSSEDGYLFISCADTYYNDGDCDIDPQVFFYDYWNAYVLPSDYYDLTYQTAGEYDDAVEDWAWSDPYSEPPAEAGYYRVRVAGKGLFEGVDPVEESFSIRDLVDLAQAEICGIEDMEYTGEELDPYVSVDENYDLYADQDYFVSYEKKSGETWESVESVCDVGEYRAVLTGAYPEGACKGFATSASFFVREGTTIYPYVSFDDEYDNGVFLKADVANALESISVHYYADFDNTEWVELSSDYYDWVIVKTEYGSDVCDSTVLEPGTYYVKVTCKDKYIGTGYEEFAVVEGNELDYADCEVSDLIYTGQPLTPEITAILPNGTELSGAQLKIKSLQRVTGRDEYGDYIYGDVSEIKEVGKYYATIVGAEGVDCQGTGEVYFQVFGGAEIGDEDGDCYLSRADSLFLHNGVLVDPIVVCGTATYEDDDGDTYETMVDLVQDEHFKITKIVNGEGEDVTADGITQPGRYTITITAIGSVTGSGTLDVWVYNENDLSAAEIWTGDDSYWIYDVNGETIPTIAVELNGKTVPEDAYTVTYLKDGVEQQLPLVGFGYFDIQVTAVEGKGYEGMAEGELHVLYESELEYLTLTQYSFAYTGKPVALKAEVYSVLDELVPSSEYTFKYYTYSAANDRITSISGAPTNPGTYMVFAVAKSGSKYAGESYGEIFTIVAPAAKAKAANTLYAKGKSVTVKYAKVKKKAQKLAVKKAFTVSKANGAVKYKLKKVSAKKKLLKQAKKKISVASNGKIKLKKGLKKGKYTLTVAVTAAGDATHNAVTKTVKVTIKVK